MTNKILAHVTVKEGETIIMCGHSPTSTIKSLMIDALGEASIVMVAWAPIREGKTITFNHKGRTLIVSPLHDYVDNY